MLAASIATAQIDPIAVSFTDLQTNQAIYDAYYAKVDALQAEHRQTLAEIDEQYRIDTKAYSEENVRRAQALTAANTADHAELKEKGLSGDERITEFDRIQADDRKRRQEYAVWRDSTGKELRDRYYAARKAEIDRHSAEMNKLLADRNANLERLRTTVAMAPMPDPVPDDEVIPTSGSGDPSVDPTLPARPDVQPAPQMPPDSSTIRRQLAITGYDTLKPDTNACVGERVTVLGRNLGNEPPEGGIYYGQGSNAGTQLPPQNTLDWPEIALPSDIPSHRRYWLAASANGVLAKGPESLMVVPCETFVTPQPEVAPMGPPQLYNFTFRIEVEVMKDCDSRGPGEWQWVGRVLSSIPDPLNLGTIVGPTRNFRMRDGDVLEFVPTRTWYRQPADRPFRYRMDAVECDRRVGGAAGNLGGETDSLYHQPCNVSDEREERGGQHDTAGAVLFTIHPHQFIAGGVFESAPLSNNTQSCKFRDNPPSNMPYKARIYMEPAVPNYSTPSE